jgi:hypothetical protein
MGLLYLYLYFYLYLYLSGYEQFCNSKPVIIFDDKKSLNFKMCMCKIWAFTLREEEKTLE